MFLKKKMAGWICLSYLVMHGCMGNMTAAPELGAVAEAKDIVSGEQVMPTYWLDRFRSAEQVLLTPQQVQQVNMGIMHAENSGLILLAGYPETIQANDIRNKMRTAMKDYSGWELPRLFKDGAQLSWQDWKAVKDNCGFDVPMGELPVTYGVTTRRTNVRLLPVTEKWYAEPKGTSVDRMHGAVLDPAEAVAVLATSMDRRFLFVQSRNSMGWVDAECIGMTSRETWMNYAAPSQYLVVIANQRTVMVDGLPITFQMGAHIPVNGYYGNYALTRMPSIENGELVERELRINLDPTVNFGPIPYSRENLVRQAFRCLNTPYDWNGTVDGVTDFALIANIYRSLGIDLPMGVAEQEQAMLTKIDLAGKTESERYAMFFDVQPGTLLFQKGHVMMYLGRDGMGEPNVIHAHSSGVTVSDLYGDDGKSGIALLSSIGSVR